MRTGTTMQNTSMTPPSRPTTLLGRISVDPSRFTTIRDWWHEMGEPVAMLDDPEATFADDTQGMIRLCLKNGVSYRAASEAEQAAFPLWLLGVFYQANP